MIKFLIGLSIYIIFSLYLRSARMFSRLGGDFNIITIIYYLLDITICYYIGDAAMFRYEYN